jgi:hypothetical protein
MRAECCVSTEPPAFANLLDPGLGKNYQKPLTLSINQNADIPPIP